MLARPSADLSTILGTGLVVAAVSAAIVIVVAHNPTVAALTAAGSAGVALIGVLQRAPVPSSTPVPVAPATDAPIPPTGRNPARDPAAGEE